MYALLTYHTFEPRVLFDDETIVLQICYYLNVFIAFAFAFPSWLCVGFVVFWFWLVVGFLFVLLVFFSPIFYWQLVATAVSIVFLYRRQRFTLPTLYSASLESVRFWFSSRKKDHIISIHVYRYRGVEGIFPVLTEAPLQWEKYSVLSGFILQCRVMN